MQSSQPITERLLHSRTVLVFGEIDAELAERTNAQLFALAGASDAPITMVISSPGGHVESGDAVHDVVRFIAPEVRMLGTGWVASAGALIYIAAPRERRFATPNTRFLLHQPLGAYKGSAADIEIQAEQILAMRRRLDGLFAAATGQPFERVARDTDRDHWLTASAALDYGLVGGIVERSDEVDEAVQRAKR
ncbi:MAG: ATP-dependent Clp protease proteolytic subunit [Deltaproteobacteria bacterium]|nr:ATP-dependent Clp protease proteolytic subunit [Deltaproteobacteria bacterium]